MVTRTVTSNEIPSDVQLLQGKKLINIDVAETSSTTDNIETTTFSFTQLVVDVSDNADNAILEYRAEVAQQYLADSDIYFTIDKYTQLTSERKAELTELREAAREAIRKLEDV